jgi:hypothetical protein
MISNNINTTCLFEYLSNLFENITIDTRFKLIVQFSLLLHQGEPETKPEVGI